MNGNSDSGQPKVSFKDILAKKHDGHELTAEEISTIVAGACQGTMEPVQIGSFLTSVYLNKLSPAETSTLTLKMKESGDCLTWPDDIQSLAIDKHSTGGVGDKVSLPLAAALAACGYKVPMISGRGLAHTGGTLDKLESVPGFTVSLSHDQMVKTLQEVGCFIAGQTKDICPADREFYKFRDATSTVKENGLITSSIVSKKAAENLKALILDVKIGSGAFMENLDKGRSLAQTMVDCSSSLGISTRSLLTDMNSPIGNMIGNALEVAESLQCLKSQGPQDLVDLVVSLGGNLLNLVDPDSVNSTEEGCARIKKCLSDGSALRKFQGMLEAQGVSSEHAHKLCDPDGDIWSVLQRSANKTEIVSNETGYVESIVAMPVAQVVQKLGGGRDKPGEAINHAVGVELLVHVGDHLEQGQAWAKVHHDEGHLSEEVSSLLRSALVVSQSQVQTRQTRVLEVVNPSSIPEA
ncbi:thymidine phosphorylase [Elysia marginata]|uniref:Thymidine phosphorylase n=1 Tax=Elysia marginata TaxID=1093978 RepID=A0AAV4GTF4_9GAST|nr:thymidine phosphorylase [Elysia marginata]